MHHSLNPEPAQVPPQTPLLPPQSPPHISAMPSGVHPVSLTVMQYSQVAIDAAGAVLGVSNATSAIAITMQPRQTMCYIRLLEVGSGLLSDGT